MSRSTGCVKVDGRLFWFVVNNGTDVGVSALYPKLGDMVRGWESGNLRRAYQCSHPKDLVQFHTDYGKGYYREGLLCSTCNTLAYEDESEYTPEEEFANSEEYLAEKRATLTNEGL